MRRAIAAITLALSLQSVAAKDIHPLKFAKNGTFHITLFEDLHFGESKFFAGSRVHGRSHAHTVQRPRRQPVLYRMLIPSPS